ncbi:MAG: nuclear transport factor 2 family protein [Myxococcales bacterium]|nr:nuclear transport factor 2 family protein [Myxococcales bacterium]
MIGAWRIDLDGDTATSTSTYWVVNARAGTTIVATGAYEDVITRRDGAWRLQRRVQTIDPSFTM